MNTEKYFDYYTEPNLKPEEIYRVITEESVLKADSSIKTENKDSLIYFKLLAQALHLEENYPDNKNELAYLYYIIGYYVGLFMHPTCGDEVGIYYLKKAVKLTSNKELKDICIETIAMINLEENI